MPRAWIVDGHNVIFAVGGLERLQATRRGDEARRLLAERLEVFARQRGEPVLLVFDGLDLPSHPEVLRTALLEVVYARRGDQAADRRILDEARRRAAEGVTVTVVTNDVRTLANALPRAVRHLRVRDFWLRHIEPPAGKDEKRIEGDFSDIERSCWRWHRKKPCGPRRPPCRRRRPARRERTRCAASGSAAASATPAC